MDNQTPPPNPTPPVVETPPSQVYTAPHIDNPPPPKSFLPSKIVLLIVILLILFGAGGTYLALYSKPKPQPIVSKTIPTSIPTPVDETASWKTYTNDQLGYSFLYPEDFKLTQGKNEIYPEYLLLKNTDKTQPQTSMGEYKSDIDYSIALYVEEPISKVPGILDHDISEFVVGGKKGIRYKNERIPSNNSTIVTVIENGKYRYRMEYDTNSEKNPNKYLLTYNQILSTFTFLNIFPTPTCRPRPACLDATPRCLMPETSDMCPKSVACTQEARQCSDGSYVGRQGPNCEFSPCPGTP